MICFLYDQLLHPDETLSIELNQDYNDLMSILKNRGMRTIFQMYFMRLDPAMRIKYRFVRDVFKNNNKTLNAFIEIRKEPRPVKEKKGIIRRTGEFVAKVLTLGLWNNK